MDTKVHLLFAKNGTVEVAGMGGQPPVGRVGLSMEVAIPDVYFDYVDGDYVDTQAIARDCGIVIVIKEIHLTVGHSR